MFNISNYPDGSKLILGLLCFPEMDIKRGQKGQKQVKNGIFSCFLACFRLCLKDFVAFGDKIFALSTRVDRPVVSRLRQRNLHKRAVGPSFKVNGPTARDFVAFGDEIFTPSTLVHGPLARSS